MGILAVDSIKSRTTGPVQVSDDLSVTGVSTFTGAIVASSGLTGNATGLTGGPNIGVGVLTATGASRITDTTESTSSTTGSVIISGGVGIAKSLFVGGNVSVGGTLTYEDVTNQDVIGLATFRSGSQFGVAGVGGTITGTGNATIAGIVTASGFDSATFDTNDSGVVITGIATVSQGTSLDGYKVEEGNSDTSTALSGEFDFELENGHVQRYSTATGGNYFPDIRVSSSQTLSSVMDVGDVISVTLMVASSSHYLYNAGAANDTVKIDNSASNIDIDWIGGAAPSAANGSGYDVYAFTIMKTAATPAYHIIGNTLGAA